MFKKILPFRKKGQEKNQSGPAAKTAIQGGYNGLPIDRFLDGATILNEPKIASLIQKIKVSVGVSDEYFDQYYLPVLQKVAAYCQSANASESFHHAHNFGLITHLVEVALYALRARLQFMYALTDKEEDIDDNKNVFAYAIFIAALHHDLAKIITDHRFFVRTDPKLDFIAWSPLSSNPPAQSQNVEYKIKRKLSNKTGKVIYKYNSHMLMAPALLCRTVPKEGFDWITSVHPKLEVDIYHAICGDYDNADAVGKSVRIGDMTSTDLGKNNIMDITDRQELVNQKAFANSTLGKVKSSLLRIMSMPTNYGLTVNNEIFSTIVKKDGHIYFSGLALRKSLLQDLAKSDVSLPEKIPAFEQLITESFTTESPSGDSMWWVKFSKAGAQVDQDKKDIKCFVFDAEVFDPDSILPDAKHLDVHLSIKSLADADKSEALKEAIKQQAQKQISNADEEDLTRSEHAEKPGKSFNSALVGMLSPTTSPLADIPAPRTESSKSSAGNIKSPDSLSDKPVTQENRQQVEPPKVQTTIKATDLLGLLQKGTEGHASPKDVSLPLESGPGNRSSEPHIKQDATKQVQAALETTVQQDKPNLKNQKRNKKSGKNRSNGQVQSARSLIPTWSEISEEMGAVSGVSPTVDVSTVSSDSYSPPEQSAYKSFVSAPESIPEPTENHTPGIDDTSPSTNPASDIVTDEPLPVDLMDLIDGDDVRPNHNDYSWMDISAEDFEAALSGTLVSFTNLGKDHSNTEGQLPSNDNESVERGNAAVLSRPSWCAPLEPSEADVPFLQDLFGVLQQAINSGLKFNRLGSRLFIVPHGIFIATPSAFLEHDFPLSIRGNYYKSGIRNSSFLARRLLTTDKNFVTGRIIKYRGRREGKISIKQTGALNGFYLVTGNRFTLTYGDEPIRPTMNLIFDHESVNGVISRKLLATSQDDLPRQ